MESESSKRTILIFGINSFLGSSLAEFFKHDHRVVGTYYNYNFKIDGVLSLPCNVVLKEDVQRVTETVRPDIIFYCLGHFSSQAAAQYPLLAEAINTNGLYLVADAAQRASARLFYFSSHHVLSGAVKNFTEIDNADPLTHLGKTQAQAEFYLQKSSLNYVIIRSGVLYGRGINPIRKSWFDTLEETMGKKEALVCDDSTKQGFLDVNYLAMVLKMLIDRNVQNRLLHFSSQDIMSYFEFAELYKEIFGLKNVRLESGRWPRPLLKSMSAEKYGDNPIFKLDSLNIETLLKIKLPTVRESLNFTRERLDIKNSVSTKNLTLVKTENLI